MSLFLYKTMQFKLTKSSYTSQQQPTAGPGSGYLSSWSVASLLFTLNHSFFSWWYRKHAMHPLIHSDANRELPKLKTVCYSVSICDSVEIESPSLCPTHIQGLWNGSITFLYCHLKYPWVYPFHVSCLFALCCIAHRRCHTTLRLTPMKPSTSSPWPATRLIRYTTFLLLMTCLLGKEPPTPGKPCISFLRPHFLFCFAALLSGSLLCRPFWQRVRNSALI